MARTLTVTAKGQVTLRKEVLRHLGVTPGEKVVVDLLPDGRAELRSAKSPTSIEEFIGSLTGRGQDLFPSEKLPKLQHKVGRVADEDHRRHECTRPRCCCR